MADVEAETAFTCSPQNALFSTKIGKIVVCKGMVVNYQSSKCVHPANHSVKKQRQTQTGIYRLPLYIMIVVKCIYPRSYTNMVNLIKGWEIRRVFIVKTSASRNSWVFVVKLVQFLFIYLSPVLIIFSLAV